MTTNTSPRVRLRPATLERLELEILQAELDELEREVPTLDPDHETLPDADQETPE